MIFFKTASRQRSSFLMAFLISSVALLPAAGIAQASASRPAVLIAAFDQPKIESGKPVRGETKAEEKSEAEQANVYRHSATVQWISRTLHTDPELTASACEWINFAVIVLAVGIPLFKIVPKALHKRSETLSQELQAARAATESANTRLSAVEAKLSGLDAEISAIRKQVEEEIREDEVRIKSSIEDETARIVSAAEHEIQVAAQQAQRGLKQFAADLAIDRAMSQLTLNAETDRALIAEFARDSNAAGGRN